MVHVAIASGEGHHPARYLCGTPIRAIEAVVDADDLSAPEPDCVVCADLERELEG